MSKNKISERAIGSASDDTRRLNPHLFGSDSAANELRKSYLKNVAIVIAPAKKRIRQDSKPLMNKLEMAWLSVLKTTYPDAIIHSQEWRVKIGNGAWFKVDHCAFVDGVWTAWECKGPKEGKNVARGTLALKCATTAFPEVKWILVWKESGVWRQQILLP